MTVFEKIKRCVELIWDFEEIYDGSDIEAFCGEELRTYPQHDEILAYFKHIEELEKENKDLRAKNKWYSEQICNKECSEVWGQIDDLQKENAELKEKIRLMSEQEARDIRARFPC